jgi:hypothetical protein
MLKVKGSSFPWLGNLSTYLLWLVVEKTFQFMWFKTDVKLITKLCFVGYYCHSIFIEILLIPFYVKNLANYGSFHTNSTCASCGTCMKGSKKYSIPLHASWYGKEKRQTDTRTSMVCSKVDTSFQHWDEPQMHQAFILVEKP